MHALVPPRRERASGRDEPEERGAISLSNGSIPDGDVGGSRARPRLRSLGCKPTRARVALAARGLVDGVVGQIDESVDCATPRRVLLRVRAVVRRPVTLRRGPGAPAPVLVAFGKVIEGSLAARTLSGKPLIHAQLLMSGKVQAFAAVPESCIPD